MNIILLSHLFPDKNDGFSGISNLARTRALKRTGHRVIIIKPVSAAPPIRYLFPWPDVRSIGRIMKYLWRLPEKEEYGGFEVFNIKWFPLPKRFLWWEQIYLFNICLTGKAKEIITMFKPDAVITSVAHPEGTYAGYLKKFCGCPVISIAEGSEMLVYPNLYRGFGKIAAAINKYCDRLVLVSDAMAEETAKLYPFTNMKVINNGFENVIFNKELYNYKREERHILAVGSLEYIKGHDLILEALKELSGWKLTLVGNGSCLKTYEKFIAENKLEGNVRIIRYLEQKELKKLYLTCGLFCMPSRSESFGVASLEALACGLPVIASNKGIMSRVIEDGNNGFILNELSPLCLEETLIKASKTEWRQDEISLSVKNFSWDKWADEITTLIEEISVLKKGRENEIYR